MAIPTASGSDIPTKGHDIECTLVIPHTQSEAAENTVPNTGLTDYFNLAFRKEPSACDKPE